MKKTRKIFALILIIATLCTSFIFAQAATNGHSQSDAVAWANAKNGQSLDYDGVYGAQCVDLTAYYYQYLGAAGYIGGNANAYQTRSIPAGWSRIGYSSGITFQPGDIAVWKTNLSRQGGYSTTSTGSLGHVGIILSADSVGFNAAEQNAGGKQYVTINWHYNSELYCVIRPDFSPAHIHSYTSTTTKAANCTESGLKTFRCSCGNSYTETIPALGHSYGAWITVTAPTDQSAGSAKRTCSRCGKTESQTLAKLVYSADGWCYLDTLPDYITASNYTIQYQNIYEKSATSSPGSDWIRGASTTTWQNSGDPYVRYTDEATSDSKVLVKKMYFHFCGPSAGVYANYTLEGNYVHYDQVDPASVNAQYCEDDAGHSVYYLYWKSNGEQVWCHSGVTCDGAWGSHGARARGWYVENTYQNRVKVTTYKYTKTSAWSSAKDPAATTVKYRFQPKHTNHTWNNGTVTKAATCVATGIKTYTCTGCSATKTEPIAINSSNHINTKTVASTASTCTVKGYTSGVYCNDCKKYISGHTEQPLADHSAPDANGNCTRCGQHVKDVTPAQPDSTEPPQQEPGCSWCGNTHWGLIGSIVAAFHAILAGLFGARY